MVRNSRSLGADSVFFLMGVSLGNMMRRGGVLHRVWENVMGLAELFWVRLYGPTPPGLCMGFIQCM